MSGGSNPSCSGSNWFKDIVFLKHVGGLPLDFLILYILCACCLSCLNLAAQHQHEWFTIPESPSPDETQVLLGVSKAPHAHGAQFVHEALVVGGARFHTAGTASEIGGIASEIPMRFTVPMFFRAQRRWCKRNSRYGRSLAHLTR